MFLQNTLTLVLILSAATVIPGVTLAQSPEPSPTPSSTPSTETPIEIDEEDAITPIPTESIVVLEEEGVLSDGDMMLPDDGSLYDVYSFEGVEGDVAYIAVESEEFDTYLVLVGPDQKIVAENDDIAQENTNSELSNITLTSDGTYRVVVNGYDRADRGNYKITIRVES
ncbi:MAG: PPC domain-containing protein [Jaaginema sp. PMC 1079.18]|nr:PPC domain-containing protein [Jaaginema sp. PMC 1080.18]MEC4852177.1 PPC domain-containing protein [Jaaginema sp. PMC 1079.18]MEC4864926.1 PPC domain-containing protein [Jaaginema sp. PMC 1078.18]